jgi:hypothetical protein
LKQDLCSESEETCPLLVMDVHDDHDDEDSHLDLHGDHVINSDQTFCLEQNSGRSYTLNFEGFPTLDDEDNQKNELLHVDTRRLCALDPASDENSGLSLEQQKHKYHFVNLEYSLVYDTEGEYEHDDFLANSGSRQKYEYHLGDSFAGGNEHNEGEIAGPLKETPNQSLNRLLHEPNSAGYYPLLVSLNAFENKTDADDLKGSTGIYNIMC